MKLVFSLFILMSFGTLICNAQRVTYSDLTYVLNHDLGNIEDYLSKKGFDYDRKDTVSDERTAYSIIFKNIIKIIRTIFQ